MDAENVAETYDRLSRMTVWEVLQQTAGRLPAKLSVVCGAERLTFSDVLERSRRLAAGLERLGLQKGDVAAVYMPNSVELVLAFYALQKLGVVVAWLNPNYRETEARFILENSGAKAVFLFREWQGFDYVGGVRGLGDLPHLRVMVVADWGANRGGAALPEPNGPRGVGAGQREPAKGDSALGLAWFHDLLAQGVAEEGGYAGPEDLSMLLYTSGTTGRPKGAMISQSQAVRAGWSYSLGVDAREEDVFIAFLALSHSYGCGALLVQPFVLGATVVILDQFSPERAFQLMETERVTLQLAAPAHYILELNHPDRRKHDLSTLRAGLIAGQIAPFQLITRVEREMGIYISSFLGSSEVGPGLSIILPYGAPLELRERAIGFPLEGTRAKVVDPETGRAQGPGEAGELLLSGWHVTRGYWRNPEETAHQIREGWLHTGDLVIRDEQECYRILGRTKECINRGGFKIIPSELESLLVQHPAISEACVVGTPNPVLGESICACVKVGPGLGTLSLEEVRTFLEGKVAPFKLPEELLVLGEFPRLGGGLKINRFGRGGVVELAQADPAKQSLRRKRGARR
jgi:acyl-CoA synthetase (AMP-forming)/AMP-acid ligase II